MKLLDGQQPVTATDALMNALESLGAADESQVIVLIRNSNGDFHMDTNLAFQSDRIGMLQTQLMWEQAAMVKTEISS
jgi:hypothetical protein